MISSRQVAVQATYMRGGTSKGVFFSADDLPEAVRDAGERRDRFMLRVAGSPDPYGKQIDGMGSGTSSTSKVVIVSRSERADCDVNYLFGAVSIEKAVVDWSGNCGNLTSAVGPFAIHAGLVEAGPDGHRLIRIWQANIGKRIDVHVPVAGGQVIELGDFELDGVTFPAAEIRIEFLEPGNASASGARAMFPTGNRTDTLTIPGLGDIQATLINAGNPTIFIEAQSVGLSGLEGQDVINGNSDLLCRLEAIRAQATVVMGLAETPQEATERRPHTPKLAFVAASGTYMASSGKQVSADDINLTARILSMGKLHHAMTGTGAVAIAVAAAIPDTIVSSILPRPMTRLTFGHPSGLLKVGAEATEINGQWQVTKATMSRTARRLMVGQVFTPSLQNG
jgi:probable AcnD-accessory protein PrpF